MVLKPDLINKSLIKVFYHDTTTGDWFKKDELYFAKSENKLNLLGNITDNHRIDGYYEFILDYGHTQISWKQKKNIKDTTKDDTRETIGFVSNGLYSFGGIVKSKASDNTLYDGMPKDVHPTYWHFSLGILKKYYSDTNAAPGLWYSDSLITRETKMTLWMRANNPKKICIEKQRNTIHKFCLNILVIIVQR